MDLLQLYSKVAIHYFAHFDFHFTKNLELQQKESINCENNVKFFGYLKSTI